MKGTRTQQPAGDRTAPRRPSPAVYRRRRLVAAVLAVLLLVGLGFAVAAVVGVLTPEKQPVADATVPAPTLTSPAATAAAAKTPKPPKPAASPSESACRPDAVSVTAATDAGTYPAGAAPILTLTVTNTGESACEINVGTSQMEFLVASGSDRIFSSVDCQDGGKDYLRKVEPGASETANFTWERNRSAPGCAAVASNPNPGYYVFTARLGEASSEAAVFELE
ncbi:DUF4232 domain-containing protein [Arthrobacter zhaoxinii]|uniref:DUF4232 domain-containing protein n=1 Tax=Arthrobacter zhaoxinii TaxID=2964616 RepID=UPI002101E386|nr:DUF4232 domain-containing protein [Arthrobacter zhaoxinii]MCQ2000270.1 DUF4232 domain-containing protein [Arthrobacter zhaoxinii]